MVGLTGLEPETSRLSGGRSNQLSYSPECPAVKQDMSKQVARKQVCFDARPPQPWRSEVGWKKGRPPSLYALPMLYTLSASSRRSSGV